MSLLQLLTNCLEAAIAVANPHMPIHAESEPIEVAEEAEGTKEQPAEPVKRPYKAFTGVMVHDMDDNILINPLVDGTMINANGNPFHYVVEGMFDPDAPLDLESQFFGLGYRIPLLDDTFGVTVAADTLGNDYLMLDAQTGQLVPRLGVGHMDGKGFHGFGGASLRREPVSADLDVIIFGNRTVDVRGFVAVHPNNGLYASLGGKLSDRNLIAMLGFTNHAEFGFLGVLQPDMDDSSIGTRLVVGGPWQMDSSYPNFTNHMEAGSMPTGQINSWWPFTESFFGRAGGEVSTYSSPSLAGVRGKASVWITPGTFFLSLGGGFDYDRITCDANPFVTAEAYLSAEAFFPNKTRLAGFFPEAWISGQFGKGGLQAGTLYVGKVTTFGPKIVE